MADLWRLARHSRPGQNGGMSFRLMLAAGVGAVAAYSGAATEATTGGAPTAIATYECVGLYWKTPPAKVCTAEFRKEGESEWHRALSLVYDPRDSEYRGSIVALTPGTSYDVRLTADDREANVKVRTRSDRFVVGETTELPGGESIQEVLVKKSGTPQAYHVVTAAAAGAHTTIDAVNHYATNITVDADYVIVRGLELRNAATHGILIKAGHHDVVVEDCHIFGWGRFAGPVSFGNVGGDLDSAVYAEKGCGNLTIQRNLIENPRGAASDWEFGHPVGPQGVSFINSSGGNVVRYNEIISTEDHGYNDGFGGGSNFSREGSPNRDSDIYGNIIRNCWDDAIESEGANMNVRVWGNFLDHFYNGIATACVSRGPIYIFRNVWGVSRRTHRDPFGGAAIKTGERDQFGGGRRYVFHNTALQPNGVQTGFTSHVNPNCVTRNNVFDVRGALTTRQDKEPKSDYDYDFFSGNEKGVAREEHGTRGAVAFIAAPFRLEFYPAPRVAVVRYGRITTDMGGGTKRDITDPVVMVPNPVIDAGEVIPNFNENFAGKAPDQGAFEVGRPALQFGRRAYLAAAVNFVPWEIR